MSLGTTDGVEREYVGHFDDGVSHAIHIPNGFPFGNFIHSSVYVSKRLQAKLLKLTNLQLNIGIK